MNLDIIINLNTRVALVCIFYWKQIESEIKSRQPFQSMINCLTNLMRFCNIEGGILYVVSYKKNSWFGKKIDLFSWFEIQNRCHPWFLLWSLAHLNVRIIPRITYSTYTLLAYKMFQVPDTRPETLTH